MTNPFGQNLRRLRKQMRITQSELAEKLGLAYSIISGWEKGYREPEIEMIIKLCGALKCSPNQLFGYDEFTELAPSIVSNSPKDIIEGRALPDIKTAQKIARALNTTVDKLWPLEEEDTHD